MRFEVPCNTHNIGVYPCDCIIDTCVFLPGSVIDRDGEELMMEINGRGKSECDTPLLCVCCFT